MASFKVPDRSPVTRPSSSTRSSHVRCSGSPCVHVPLTWGTWVTPTPISTMNATTNSVMSTAVSFFMGDPLVLKRGHGEPLLACSSLLGSPLVSVLHLLKIATPTTSPPLIATPRHTQREEIERGGHQGSGIDDLHSMNSGIVMPTKITSTGRRRSPANSRT